MSVEHLDVLNTELPELFQSRDLSPVWDDDLIIIPIDDPESYVDNNAKSKPEAILLPDDSSPDYINLENEGASLGPAPVGVPSFAASVLDALGGAHAGAPSPIIDPTKMPPPDCLAFYLPFHYYHPTWWGVYLLFDGVLWLARDIVHRSGGKVHMIDAMRASRIFLYYHEAFHHKTECFATRIELTHRKPFYKTGFERFFQKTFGTDDCLEEALADASALEDTNKRIKDLIIDQALAGYVRGCPPGYRLGVEIRKDIPSVRCRFAEENQQICLPHLPKKNPEVWRTAPHLFDGISNIKGRVNYVIPRNSPLVARLPLKPLLPPSKLVKKLTDLAKLEFVRHGGNHDVYRVPSGKSIFIPRHPRDLGRGLVRQILREAGLEMGIEEFLEQ